MLSKQHLLSGLICAIVLIFSTGDVASAYEIEQECFNSVDCDTACPNEITNFSVELTDIYADLYGTWFAEFDVTFGGRVYKQGTTWPAWLNLQSAVLGYPSWENHGNFSADSVGCHQLDTTVHIVKSLGSCVNSVLFKLVASSRNEYAGVCGCEAIKIVPDIDPTIVENGVPPCQSQIFDPIDARSGNVYYEQRDVSIGSWSGLPIIFTRSYNSSAEVDPTSVLGPKWTHNFNYHIEDIGDGFVEITMGTGQILRLKDGTYPLGIGHKYEVDYDAGTERYTVLDYSTARRFVFNDDGTLDSLYDRDYGRLSFSYSNGLLHEVMDAAGRYLTFHYNDSLMLETIKKMNDSVVATYEYSDNYDTLKKVIYSNGDWESYHYKFAYKTKGLLDVIETSDGTELNFDYDYLARGVSAALNDTLNVENVLYYMELHEPDTLTYTTIATGSDIVSYKSILTSDSTYRLHSEIINGSCGCGSEYRYYDNYDVRAIDYPNARTDSIAYESYGKVSDFYRDKDGTNERQATFTHGGTYYQLTNSTLPSLHSTGDAEVIFTRNSSGDVTLLRSKGNIDASRAYDYSIGFTYGDDGELEHFDGPRDSTTDVYDTTGYHYYSNGDLQYIYRANGEVFEFDTLNDLGNLIWMVSPNGDTTRYEFDDYGRLSKLVLGAGLFDSLTTSFEHNYAGNITKVTYPKGNYVEYVYDDNGLLDYIENQLGEKIQYEYDLYSRCSLAVIYDSSENMTKYEQYRYTPRGQLHKIVYDDSTYSQFEYDDMGNCETATDANGNYVGYKYDNLNRLDAIWGFNCGDSFTTALEYDNNSNLTKVIDPDDNEFIYLYTDDGRLVYDSSGATGPTYFGYDPSGNLIAAKNAAGDSTNFTYDEVNRLTRIAYPDSLNIEYEYDGTQYSYGLGRLYKETTPVCATTFQYDRFGRLIKEYRETAGDTTAAGESITRTTSYSYDKNGNLLWLTYPSGFMACYYYDNLDRVTTITWTKSGGHYEHDTLVYNIKYDPFGDAVEWTLGNGIVVSQSHNLRYFTDTISTGASGVLTQSYEFDSVGNVTMIKDSLDALNDVTLAYDSLYQLNNAASSSYPDSLREYYYSKNGNRDSLFVDTGTARQEITYSYTDNRLTEITDGQTTTYLSYDDIGSVKQIQTGSNTTTYQYNDAGQLVAVDDSATAQYFYDGRGRRIKVLAGGSGRYVYYDRFGRICSEFDGLSRWARDFIYLNGRIIARLEKHYESEPEKMGEGLDIDPPPPLPLPIDIDVFYYHTDHLGTPLVMTDKNGNAVWKGRYYPFGELYYEWVSAKNYIRFPGQWEDEETDLYYNWHRYYDPTMGRYLQADPLAAPAVSNIYGYARNNPLRFIDPTGLWVPSWNPTTKTITVMAEEGDNLASLYAGMGITSADYPEADFINMYKVNETIFNITDFILKNKDFNPAGNTGSNCFGFASYASGASSIEVEGVGKTFIEDAKLNLVPLGECLISGDIAVWKYTANIRGLSDKDAEEADFILEGVPAHAAIYIITDASKTKYFLQRATKNASVTRSTNEKIQLKYQEMMSRSDGVLKWPPITARPKFYRR